MLHRKTVALILVSFAMLFIEVALIRWVSTESRIFAYVNNLILLSCFLGIGYGSYSASRPGRFYLTPLGLSFLILLLTLPLRFNIDGQSLHLFRDIPTFLSGFTDSIIWVEPEQGVDFSLVLLGIGTTLLLFTVIFIIFIPLGRILGKIFEESTKIIRAYSINIVFSIVGIWFFSGLSLFYAPPYVWFTLVVPVLLAIGYLERAGRIANYAACGVLAVSLLALIYPGDTESFPKTVWSPYQKLTIQRFIDRSAGLDRGYYIDVNNAGYMTLLDLSDRFIRNHPQYYSLNARKYSQYDIPYRFAERREKVLILGAGAGNDASGAIRNNALSIDAVEIDPGIYRLGHEYHPERAYSNPRVNVVIDDARSFLKRTEKKYDIISVGLLDSHTHSSSYNNTRLDHYVYTRESFSEMKEKLNDSGILTVIFEAQRPWIAKRLHGLLEDVFDSPPLAFELRNNGLYGWGGIMYICEKREGTIARALANDSYLEWYVTSRKIDFSGQSQFASPVKPTSDDWPYLYLEKPVIPKMHLVIIIILGLAAVFCGRKMVRDEGRFNWNFFFLGAGFLLLEFQNVSKATLLFGSTWLVNSLIFTAILLLILAANYYTHKFKIRSLSRYYVILLGVIITNFLVPLDSFNNLGYWPRILISLTFLNLPVFFAGIIFIESFRRSERKDLAFGSNLIGAACGGLLESLSFMVGIKALLLGVAVFYVLSFMSHKQYSPARLWSGYFKAGRLSTGSDNREGKPKHSQVTGAEDQ